MVNIETCKHKFINTKDGTNDAICTKCGKRAKQGVMFMGLKNEIQINNINENVNDKILKEIAKGIALNRVLGR